MDYEKAYKNLVAKIKIAHLNAQTDSTKNALEDILPELAESEDERTRNEIITFIEQAIHSGGGVSVSKEKENKWLAYLEKQKDAFENGRQFGIMQEQERRELEWDEQKEQKPVDKEQDSIAFLEQHGYTIVPPHAPVSIVPSSEATLTKWSEEDERILKGIIGKIDHDQTYGVSKAEMLSFLKSLRPSWKPSEEDKKILHAIELLVGQLDGGETINGFSSSDMLRVLKSLY